MAGIRRLILDVVIPSTMPSSELAVKLAKLGGVDGVDIITQEVEHRVDKIKVTIEGDDINFESVKVVLDKLGASLQGVDRISCGKRLVN
ncbi:MAG: DUF211 domain-containing protein [Candidatus Micrarchaeota archaeon]